MNYFGHFFIHEEGENPMYSAGLILPDLSRGFITSPARHLTAEGEFEELIRGCHQHYLADKRFHSSKFFTEGSEVCTQMLKQAPFQETVERKWFLGHILFELLLDRVLVKHYPGVLASFYHNLQTADKALLGKFLDREGGKEVERFLKIFEHFRSAAYIRNYTDNNLFAYSLSRIMQRAGLPGLCAADKVVLYECAVKLEQGYFKDVQAKVLLLKKLFE